MHAHVINVDFTDADAAIKGLDDLIPTREGGSGLRGRLLAPPRRLARGLLRRVRHRGPGPLPPLPPVGAEMDGVRITSAQVGQVMGSA